MMPVLAVAAGGAIGASLRYGLTVLMGPASLTFPWAILLVNIIGCAVMGALTGLDALTVTLTPPLRLFVMTGVLGGFTTFSAFALDTILLWQRGEGVKAIAYVTASVALSLLAFLGAMTLVKDISHG